MDDTSKPKPPGAGKSSFDLIDPDKVFGQIDLHSGITLLDLACGPGAYSLAASPLVGDTGSIIAIDLWEEGIAALKEQAKNTGIRNIRAMIADINKKIPLPDSTIDVCLMANVLHDLIEADTSKGTLPEIKRTLTSDAQLAIIEFKKIEGPPGPPIHIRLSPEELQEILKPYGFHKERVTDVGPYNYMMTFRIDQQHY
ncbi:MAG: class I SAM-dependent methyltransferase [Chloroflexi bacterium]|jgi:ubiquinone/menaquinone biosynthesis C-methylase UbiE|nr:class I SAM-dependent methyltransferase [Chloroflexota bacterium]